MEIYSTVPKKPISPPTAFALGYFDGVHIGHQKVLAQALEYKKQQYKAGVFTFSVNNNSPDKKSRALLIQTPQERLSTMEEMGFDMAYYPEFDVVKQLSPYDFVKRLYDEFGVRALSCGMDFRFGINASGDINTLRSLCEEYEIKLDIIPDVVYGDIQASSSAIRKSIAEGDMGTVSNILGRYYSIYSEVVHGNHLGNKLGFPTVNQRIPTGKAQPKFGVYATRIILPSGEKYAGATNVGIKPTVGSENVLAETHIIGYSGDLYGEKIKIEFIKFLRKEEKFKDLEELVEAIKANIEEAIQVVKHEDLI